MKYVLNIISRKIMQHKITIGIPIESHMIAQIRKKTTPLKDLPIKWYNENNMHIDLVNVGWVEEGDVQRIRESILSVSRSVEAFSVLFTHIAAVNKKIDRTDIADAQIVRVEGEDNDQLRELHEKICNALSISYNPKKSFKPYVVLGRMRARKWSSLETYPSFPIGFQLQMDILNISILESTHVDGTWHVEPISVYELQ
jgi:2'-5' RNA ligase